MTRRLFDFTSCACSALVVLLFPPLLASCGTKVSDAPATPPATADSGDGTGSGTGPGNGTGTGTGDGNGTSNGGAPNPCTASECVDGDGFCDIGFCDGCVRDDDCSDSVTPSDPSEPNPSDPGDEPTNPGDPGDGNTDGLPACAIEECVDGDGSCDVDLCADCTADADCDPNGPTNPNPPPTEPDGEQPPLDCDIGDDCQCLPNECVAGDGFCDEDWCDGCEDDPDCNGDANERCFGDEDCCLPDECIAGDGLCDEGLCQGCEVDLDCA